MQAHAARRRTSLRGAVAGIVMAVLIAGALSVVPSPSRAETGVSVSGVVRLDGQITSGEVRVVLRKFSGQVTHIGFTDRETVVDEAGTYRFDGVPSGEYDLLFDYTGTHGFADRWHSGGGMSLWDGRLSVHASDVSVDADLEPGGVISGVVRDSKGAPLGGVTVTAQISHPSLIPGLASTTVSDANGVYRISGVTPGTVYLRYALPGFPDQARGQDVLAQVPGLLDVSAGSTIDGADMTMFRSMMIEVDVVCSTCNYLLSASNYWVDIERETPGAPGVWAQVGVAIPKDTVYMAWTQTFTFAGGLVPGRYRAVGRSGSSTVTSTAVTLLDGGEPRAVLDFRPRPQRGDYFGTASADVLVRDRFGILLIYPSNGRGGWDRTQVVGQGWQQFTALLMAGDFDGAGWNDVLARSSTGALYLYPTNRWGGWEPRRQVGSGWQSFTAMIGPGDFDGDRYADVIARASNGALYLYPGNGAGGWNARKTIGSGWNGMTAIIAAGDFDGDYKADIIARSASGALYLYRGDGLGGWLPRKTIGSGWGQFTSITCPGDFNGDGTQDVLARTANGTLFLYPGNGAGGWLPRKQFGSGWQHMSIVG